MHSIFRNRRWCRYPDTMSQFHCLNCGIVQSTHSILVDQTSFIQGIVILYVPRDLVIPKIDTPFRMDHQFNDEIKPLQ